MGKYETLKRIALDYDEECDYLETKSGFLKQFTAYHDKCGMTVIESVNAVYYYCFETEMSEHGMTKFVGMLAGTLFMIEHGDVEEEQIQVTHGDIEDFETGDYDDLFTPEDLILIKADVSVVKDYIAKHPQLLE